MVVGRKRLRGPILVNLVVSSVCWTKHAHFVTKPNRTLPCPMVGYRQSILEKDSSGSESTRPSSSRSTSTPSRPPDHIITERNRVSSDHGVLMAAFTQATTSLDESSW